MCAFRALEKALLLILSCLVLHHVKPPNPDVIRNDIIPSYIQWHFQQVDHANGVNTVQTERQTLKNALMAY